ncbi:MAG: anti-sigma factor family protein [Chloroflexota bacterium]
MTNCQVYHGWMSLKLDNLLKPEEEQALLAHLQTCAVCQAQWAAMQFVSDLLAEQPLVAVPAGFVARLEQRLAVERSAWRREVLGAASLVVGALALVTVGLSSLAGVLIRLWPLVQQPSLWDGIKGWFGQLADVALAVGEALMLLFGSLFDLAGGPVLLLYMLAVILLTLLSSRLVLRRMRAYQPVRR